MGIHINFNTKHFSSWEHKFFCCFLVFSAFLSTRALAEKDGINKYYQRLMSSDLETILRDYSFIPDFGVKEPERDIGPNAFWPYPFKLPPYKPDFYYPIDDFNMEFPVTRGVGRAIEHLNRGRIYFKKGMYKRARDTWLSARARYGEDAPFWLRRDLYFIGLALLKMGEVLHKKPNRDSVEQSFMETHYGNAALFLSEAFLRRKTPEDPALDKVKIKVLTYLSRIYFNFKRFPAAFGAAQEALNYMRLTGDYTYRPQILEMLAESMILNRSYFEAVQDFDTLIRITLDEKTASRSFARVGDIYFDLNNYQLAENMYGLSLAADKKKQRLSPWQAILRGESLFWLKRFDESLKMFQLGMKAARRKGAKQLVDKETLSWAKLRMADNYMAMKMDKSIDAYLEKPDRTITNAYYDVEYSFPESEAAKIAELRRLCLEDVTYQKNYIKHSRSYLEGLLESITPNEAKEYANACLIKSYAIRDSSESTIGKIKSYFSKFPYSRYLGWMSGALVKNRRSRLSKLLQNKDYYSAIAYFEKYRNKLFSNLTKSEALGLFESYVRITKSREARNLYPMIESRVDKLNPLIILTYVAEAHNELDQDALDFLSSKKFTPANNSEFRNLANRIWESNSEPSRSWVLDTLLNMEMENSRPTLFCTYVFPKAATFFRERLSNTQAITEARQYLKGLVDKVYPLWLQDDPGCALSILDLEASLNKNQLYNIWIQRKGWPPLPVITKYFWMAAEKAYEKNNKTTARDLWNWISENGSLEDPLVAFSRARLNPVRSELDDLWGR